MLPIFWRNQYQILLNYLEEMQNLLNSETTGLNQVQNCFGQLKTHFYQQVVPLKADDIDLSLMAKWKSLQTESYRTMRLLETDLLFWQSSRNEATRQSRLRVISDRTNTMIRFCQEILKLHEADGKVR